VDRTRRVRVLSVSLAVLGIQLGSAGPLRAQAFVPPKGEGTVAVTYQNYYTTGHFDVQGRKNKNGATHTKAVVTELDYALTDTLGLTVTLPFVASKYTGSASYFVGPFETFAGPLDDGAYHGAFQDIHIEVRRMFAAGPVTVTPLVGASFPTHDYVTVGEAVPGRRRRELQLGASAGVSLDPVLPGVSVHARYAYGAAERVQGFPATRSTIDLEGGYAATSRVGVRGLVSWQIRHKGPRPPELQQDWKSHDRFIVSGYVNVGGGASISLRRSTEIYALWIATIAGHDGAHVSRTLAVGLSWSFGGGLGGFGAPAKASHR
jgi:hypothetical protein